MLDLTARLALTIMFCVSLGNIVLKGIDFWLGYFKVVFRVCLRL
jgi:hypothetical protein